MWSSTCDWARAAFGMVGGQAGWQAHKQAHSQVVGTLDYWHGTEFFWTSPKFPSSNPSQIRTQLLPGQSHRCSVASHSVETSRPDHHTQNRATHRTWSAVWNKHSHTHTHLQLNCFHWADRLYLTGQIKLCYCSKHGRQLETGRAKANSWLAAGMEGILILKYCWENRIIIQISPKLKRLSAKKTIAWNSLAVP